MFFIFLILVSYNIYASFHVNWLLRCFINIYVDDGIIFHPHSPFLENNLGTGQGDILKSSSIALLLPVIKIIVIFLRSYLQ